jgi:hypothetical protein
VGIPFTCYVFFRLKELVLAAMVKPYTQLAEAGNHLIGAADSDFFIRRKRSFLHFNLFS